ncbi:hypothetical protein RHSIM_Rhsim05G0221000 [Rhododendron simsii]|uniref:Uncharacterized protein n=1 Tax=Rhododendron simsii TaxID=118357 RepID=A0A834GZP3_RHOSS|nr:hypothetical protein RHSIM_Rhsim05G0221000 [Rhododendron simsii]
MENSLLADTVTIPSIQALAYTNSSSLQICVAPSSKIELESPSSQKETYEAAVFDWRGSDDAEGGGEFYGYGGDDGGSSFGPVNCSCNRSVGHDEEGGGEYCGVRGRSPTP